jgi:hypothetical protein
VNELEEHDGTTSVAQNIKEGYTDKINNIDIKFYNIKN